MTNPNLIQQLIELSFASARGDTVQALDDEGVWRDLPKSGSLLLFSDRTYRVKPVDAYAHLRGKAVQVNMNPSGSAAFWKDIGVLGEHDKVAALPVDLREKPTSRHAVLADAFANGAKVERQTVCGLEYWYPLYPGAILLERHNYRLADPEHRKAFEAFQRGEVIEVLYTAPDGTQEWCVSTYPTWKPDAQYRLFVKWRAEREAQEAGKTIEARYPGDDVWVVLQDAAFTSQHLEYRVKPEQAPVDPFAELRAAYDAGKTIQINLMGGWTSMRSRPQFDGKPEDYRVKPEELKWAAERQAYAEGKTIQCRSVHTPLNEWLDCVHGSVVGTPRWVDGTEYRVKPELVTYEAEVAKPAQTALAPDRRYTAWSRGFTGLLVSQTYGEKEWNAFSKREQEAFAGVVRFVLDPITDRVRDVEHMVPANDVATLLSGARIGALPSLRLA